MSDEPPDQTRPTTGESGREAEILRARRDSLERLREAGVPPFALRFEPDAHAADIVAEFEGALGARRGVGPARDAGRPRRPRAPHGQAHLPRPARRHRRPPAVRRGGDAGRAEPRAAGRDRPRRHRRRRRARRAHPARRAVPQGRDADDADEGAPPAAGEVARAEGSGPPAAPGDTCIWRPTSRPGARRWRARRCCARSARSSTGVGSSRSRRPCCSRSPAARTPARSPRTTTRWTST